MTLAAVAAITTGCPPPEPPLPPVPETGVISAEFDNATLTYYFADDAETESDFFVFEFFSDEESEPSYLDISFTSDFFEEVLSAVPEEGTYNFSDTFEKFTFDYAGYSADGEDEIEVTDGEFSIARTGSNYSIGINFELEDGRILKSEYEGEIYPFLGGNEDIVLDFDEMEYVGIDAFEIPDYEGMWQIYFEAESYWDSELELILTVNTETGLSELPTGEFPMAAEPRKGVAGTTEPAALYRDEEDEDWYLGCYYFDYYDDFGSTLYAVPDEGFVNIAKEGLFYTIEFSFTMPTGKTISGNSGLFLPAERDDIRSSQVRHFIPRWSRAAE
jgi:hypothetical protein